MSDDNALERFVGGVERHAKYLINWYDLDSYEAATELRNIADRIETGRGGDGE